MDNRVVAAALTAIAAAIGGSAALFLSSPDPSRFSGTFELHHTNGTVEQGTFVIGLDLDAAVAPDAGPADLGPRLDATFSDAASPDASTPDARSDAAPLDTGPRDTGGNLDAAVTDSGANSDATPADAGPRDAQVAGTGNLGTNLMSIIYWSSPHVFTDVMKQSMPWRNDSASPDLDSNGNLRSGTAYTLLFSNNGQAPGDYELSWDGDAAFNVQGWQIVSQSVGRMLLRTNGTGQLEIDATRIGTPYPQNVRLQMLGASGRFNLGYLADVSSYTTVRFMDWQRTNDNIVPSWTSRPQLSNARYSGPFGPPIEIMVELANTAHVDPWFNIHHRADDIYVRSMAQLVCSSLAPDRRVYVEHSNEVWNGVFPVYDFAVAQGHAFGLSGDDFLANQLYHALRSSQIHAIWTQECGAARVIRVLGGWAANDWSTNQMLNFAESRNIRFDALAIAPYFGGDIRASEAFSVDNIFSILNSRSIPQAVGWMRAQAVVGLAHNIQVIGYEGGQHIVDFGNPGPAVNAVMDAANRDPRMGVAYDTYLAAWRQNIGANSIFAHYLNVDAWGTSGRWGARQTLNESCSSSPKCSALLRYSGH